MEPITITTAVAKIVSTTLQLVQTCNEYYQKYKAVNLQLVCMQTQCSIIEVALLQIQDVFVHDSARFERLQSVSVLANNYKRTLGACQIVFAILKERLLKLNNHLHDDCGKPNWQLKVKVVWNDQESAMLLKNIEGQASAITLLLNVIQMKTQVEMLSFLSRKESESILKTASDDADTLSVAHEKDASFALSDGESVTTSKLDGTEFEFDFEVINTAAYRKVFNKARSKIAPEKGNGMYSPPDTPTSSGASAPETVGLPFINAHAVIHPVMASQESEVLPSHPNPSSQDIRSHSVLPKDSAEDAGDGTGGTRKDDAKNEFSLGEYRIGTIIGIGRQGIVKLAWKKNHSNQFAVKVIRREPNALGTGLLRDTFYGFVVLRGLSHPNIIRLHEIFVTNSYYAIVLDNIRCGSLADYFSEHAHLNEYFSQRFFAQIISAIGYLHRKGTVNPTLSCSKVLLASTGNVVLTGFSNVRVFDVRDGPEFGIGKPIEKLYCSIPEENPRFYEARQADVWSCGVLLYFMLAGSLPFGGLVNTTSYDAQLPLRYISSDIMKFPDYFPMRVRLLVRRMLAKQSTERAELPEVAGHSWVSDEADITSDIIDSPISGPSSLDGYLPPSPFGPTTGLSSTVMEQASPRHTVMKPIKRSLPLGNRRAASLIEAELTKYS